MIDEDEPDIPTTFWTVALYFRTRCYGGPEEGGWWYDQDVLVACDDPLMREHEAVLPTIHLSETDAFLAAHDCNEYVDDVINAGRPPLDSVLSTGRYVACVHPGWPPAFDPAERPIYE